MDLGVSDKLWAVSLALVPPDTKRDYTETFKGQATEANGQASLLQN